jgi:hypothetical protein
VDAFSASSSRVSARVTSVIEPMPYAQPKNRSQTRMATMVPIAVQSRS